MKAHQLAALLFCASIANAEAQTQRTGDANARATQQVQQLSAERTQLKAENDKLKQEIEAIKKSLSAATSSQNALQQRLKAAESASAREGAATQQNTEALEKSRAQMQELIGRYRETAQTLKDVETDRNVARGDLKSRERELQKCVESNVGLYELNKEVLDRYEKKGMFTSLAEKEPFTQIQRTRLENLIDSYKDRAADLRLETAKQPN